MTLLVAGCAAEQGLEDGQEQSELVGEFEPMDTPFDPVQQKTPGGVHLENKSGRVLPFLKTLQDTLFVVKIDGATLKKVAICKGRMIN